MGFFRSDYMPPQKSFSGDTYMLNGRFRNKQKAQSTAMELRARGYRVRVHKAQSGNYGIYVHRVPGYASRRR